MDKLSRVLFLLLCHVTSIAKQLTFLARADQVDALVAALEHPLFNQRSGRIDALLEAAVARSALMLWLYSGTAVMTCALWSAFPLAYHLQGKRVEFPVWIGVDYNTPLMFWIVWVYSNYVVTLVGVANTTMDAFIGTVLYQCTIQLKILRWNFKNLTYAANQRSIQFGENYESVLDELFLNCYFHYHSITKMIRLLEEVFAAPLLIQITISGWILCMAAYKILSLNIWSFEFASILLFILCILTELFIFCYFGNEVKVESDRLSWSVQFAGWAGPCRAPRALLRRLLVVGERARRPLQLTVGTVLPLSLSTFLKILKSSYSFYTVLRQTK